jgi:nitroreductase
MLSKEVRLELSNKPYRNETIKTIYERHSSRVFTETPVPEEDIYEILHAANRAPSAHNQQSWRFVTIRGEMKSKLVNLISDRSVGLPRPSSVLLRMAARSIASAPLVIAVTNSGELIKRGPSLFSVEQTQGDDFFRTMEIQSSAAAIQNMLLAATSLGISTVWLGIMYLVKDEVLRLLAEPEGEFMAIIAVGYEAKQGSSPKKRPLEMVIKNLK